MDHNCNAYSYSYFLTRGQSDRCQLCQAAEPAPVCGDHDHCYAGRTLTHIYLQPLKGQVARARRPLSVWLSLRPRQGRPLIYLILKVLTQVSILSKKLPRRPPAQLQARLLLMILFQLPGNS